MDDNLNKNRAGIYAQVSEEVVAANSGTGMDESKSSVCVASSYKNYNPHKLHKSKTEKYIKRTTFKNSSHKISSDRSNSFMDQWKAYKITPDLSTSIEDILKTLRPPKQPSDSAAKEPKISASLQTDGQNSKPHSSSETVANAVAEPIETEISQVTPAAATTTTVSQKEPKIVIAVINELDPDGEILPEIWKQTEVSLAKIFLPILKEHPGHPPCCRDGGWHEDIVKLIACADQRSVDLYRLAISRIGESWPGVKLKVVMKNEIPRRPRMRSRIPAEPSNPKEILNIIRKSNPQLDTSTWKLIKLKEPRDYQRIATFAINFESLKRLFLMGYVISYGFSSIIFKSNDKNALDYEMRLVASAAPLMARINGELSSTENNTDASAGDVELPDLSLS